MLSWNYNTSIGDGDIRKVKEKIIANGKVSSGVFNLNNLQNIASGAVRYPVIFLIDTSTSLSDERENLNNAMDSFINNILDSNSTLSSSIDFSIVCFNSEVYVKRPFDLLSERDRNNSRSNYAITKSEMKSSTQMASGLFVAWYLAESRKIQYKNAGVKYKQPIFVLISDMGNNEDTKFDGEPLIYSVIRLMNDKSSKHKLAFLKTLYGTISKHYDGKLNGIGIKATSNLTEVLEDVFIKLIASIYADDQEYIEPEDDGEIIFDNDYEELDNNSSSNNSIFTELMEMFGDVSEN